MRVLLFGFKGCGKTHYGKLLAPHLNLPFVDTDFLIEEASGKTPREFSLLYGEKAFRVLEKEIVHGLSILSSAVIALGGGAILDPQNALHFQTLGKLIYIKADKETLKKRIFSGALPSYLDPQDPEGSFERMYALREPLYESIPATQIITGGKSNDEVISTILQSLENPYGK